MKNSPDQCLLHSSRIQCCKCLSSQYSRENNVGDAMSISTIAETKYTMEESGTDASSTALHATKISTMGIISPEEEKSVSSRSSCLSSSLSLLLSKPTTRLNTTITTSFTKGYYYYRLQRIIATLISSSSSSALIHLSRVAALCSSLSKIIQSLITLILVITVTLPTGTDAVGFYQQSKCETFGWNAFPVWKYRAKARWVPPLRADRKMQKEFFKLFRGGDRYKDEDSSSSEEDSYEDDLQINFDDLKHVADMCPKDAFFYSLSPKHLEAITTLIRMFVAQPSPPDVLKLAKALIRSPYVNPKVWYYAIIGAAEERPDMTGFKLAHPIDAMPDLFIPGPMLFELRDKYRSALRERSDFDGAVNGTLVHREKRATSSTERVKRRYKKVQRKNEEIAATFGKIEIGHHHRNNNDSGQSSGKRNVVKLNNLSSIKTQLLLSSDNNSTSRSLYQSTSASKNKRKKITRNMKKADVAAALKGNVTEFQADNGMWKRARIDAFDDCIVVDGSVGVRNGIENKLWYFREDMMVNQHHWYWHQEYPLNSTRHRPRRAELFFYMHRNLIARYNAERLSNGLPLVEMFDIRPGAEIKTAYDSLLADVNSGRFWTARPHGVHLTDIIHEKDPDFERNLLVGQYNTLYGRLIRSIQVGHLLVGPIKTLKIRNTKGIEPLGNTVEASELSVNPLFYDAMGFHNLGHQLIGLSVDPKFKHGLPTGIMADTLTTMRDPEFYSYHTVVDDLFDMYKKTLPPYFPHGGEYPLRWDGVEILDVEVISKNGGKSKNQLRTFWANRRFELGPGVDQSIHKGDLEVDVCAVHLNHEPFDFKITVTLDPCAVTKLNKGSVRIFLAPRYDEHGNRYPLKIQRRLMIHMDTFPVDLRVGRNVIYRRSFDSNAVTPWSKHFKQYENAPKNPSAADFCGCGWPTHLYIPKGSPEGTHFDLFVMLTNFDNDFVDEHPEEVSYPEPCNSPYMYCGVKQRQYPDRKPMGYPFDRLPFSVPIKCPKIGAGPLWSLLLCNFLQLFLYKPVTTLEEYVSYAPNMVSTVVEITHLDKLVW